MSKLDKMIRFIPGLYKPQTNVKVRGLLYSWSGEDDALVQAIQDAKEQLYVKTAKLQYLDALGSNVGVFRPREVGLADEQFRKLIPALSFRPKQIIPTIKLVLDAFFGTANPKVQISEINPNEVVIQIPSSIPSLRRSLRGSAHLKVYSGVIQSIDNILKTMAVDLDSIGGKVLAASEVKGGTIGQNLVNYPILDNTAGSTGIILQFGATYDLSKFTAGGRFVFTNPRYPGPYLPDPRMAYTVTKQRGILGQSITAGTIVPTLTMTDSSGIPDGQHLLIFNMGKNNVEAEIRCFGRPNNTTLLIDPSYTFSFNHSIGEAVNVIVKPYIAPAIDGRDYSVYIVGVTAARILAQQIVESVCAAGVVVRWIVVEPRCIHKGYL